MVFPVQNCTGGYEYQIDNSNIYFNKNNILTFLSGLSEGVFDDFLTSLNFSFS